jgi:hypothetical protein
MPLICVDLCNLWMDLFSALSACSADPPRAVFRHGTLWACAADNRLSVDPP